MLQNESTIEDTKNKANTNKVLSYFSVYPFPLWWLREYIYFVLLSSSNRKYELLPIV